MTPYTTRNGRPTTPCGKHSGFAQPPTELKTSDISPERQEQGKEVRQVPKA